MKNEILTPIDKPCSNEDKMDYGCGPQGVLQLWVMEFEVTGKGKGCAVCKASNPHEAEMSLKSSGVFNGTPNLYKVTRIEQIIVPPCNELIAEQVVTFQDIGLLGQ